MSFIGSPNDPGLPAGFQNVPAPTGVPATDELNLQRALAALPANGILLPQPGTYAVRPSALGTLLYPNNSTIFIPAGTTIRVPDNSCTDGSHAWNLFVAANGPPTNVRFIIDGIIDGNVANGNHNTGASAEFIFGINMSDPQNCSIGGAGIIRNWRGEAICNQHSTSDTKGFSVWGTLWIINCGMKQGSGDAGNPRQGISCQSGVDISIKANFDTIGAYAIDFETVGPGDHLDNLVVSPECIFRNVGANGAGGGNVNLSPVNGGTIGPRVSIPKAWAAGTLPTTNIYPTPPAGLAKLVTKTRYSLSADLVLNSAVVADVSPADFDITLPAQPGDIIRVEANWGMSSGAQFTSFDVATWVAGAPVNYLSGHSLTTANGVMSWRTPATGVAYQVSGSIYYTVVLADLVNGQVTLRLRYKQSAGANVTLFSGSVASATPALLTAENMGAGY